MGSVTPWRERSWFAYRCPRLRHERESRINSASLRPNSSVERTVQLLYQKIGATIDGRPAETLGITSGHGISGARREARCSIKAGVSDPRAKAFAFSKQKTMYGGRSIAKGDLIFVFASENEGVQV